MRGLYLIILTSVLTSCGVSDVDCKTNYTYEKSETINCDSGNNANPFEGCWRSEACIYSPQNFIYNECKGLRNQIEEDYWVVPILSFTTNPRIVDGIPMGGLISRDYLYFDNDQCSGEPVITHSNFREWNPLYYSSGDEYLTRQGLVANIFIHTNGIKYADTGEYIKFYDITYFESPDRMCMGDPDYPFEIINEDISVPSVINLEICGILVKDRNMFIGTGLEN